MRRGNRLVQEVGRGVAATSYRSRMAWIFEFACWVSRLVKPRLQALIQRCSERGGALVGAFQ
jgi:hypothetical protein